MFTDNRATGFTMIELVMFIVVVGVGLTGILSALNQGVFRSAEPQVRKQALAIAESLMEEIALMPFTYCDPDDPNVTTASAPAGCAVQEVIGPVDGGVTQFRTSSPFFNNVNDYDGYSMPSIVDIGGSAIPNLTGYSASVTVQNAALNTITAAGSAVQISVTVNGPSSFSLTLDGYRTRYAPNAAP